MTLWVSSIGAAVVASVLQIDNCLTIGQTDGWKDDAKLILEGPSMNYDSTELLLALPKSQGGCHQVVGNYNDTLWHAEHHVLRLWIFLSCTTLLDYHWISCWPPYLFVRLVWVVVWLVVVNSLIGGLSLQWTRGMDGMGCMSLLSEQGNRNGLRRRRRRTTNESSVLVYCCRSTHKYSVQLDYPQPISSRIWADSGRKRTLSHNNHRLIVCANWLSGLWFTQIE